VPESLDDHVDANVLPQKLSRRDEGLEVVDHVLSIGLGQCVSEPVWLLAAFGLRGLRGCSCDGWCGDEMALFVVKAYAARVTRRRRGRADGRASLVAKFLVRTRPSRREAHEAAG
jgi:hypothetical protein